MNASADYQVALRILRLPLPAYVTYTQRTHANVFGPIERDDTETLVVRTSDGKTIKGKASTIELQGHRVHDNILSEPVFKTNCYRATGARLGTYRGAPAEAITLKATCESSKGQ